jgi:hypothetical protein
VRCWQCGVEPLEVHDITTFGDLPDRKYLPSRWPPGDHEHAVQPPTPGELAEQGDRVAARIMAIGAE